MEEISRIFLGKYASSKDKIKLMGELVILSKDGTQEKSDEEIRSEIMSRFESMGLKKRANSAAFLEEEISSEGFKSIVYFLYRLSLTLDDGIILKEHGRTPIRYNSSPSSHSIRKCFTMRKKEDTFISTSLSPDDGCGESASDNSCVQTRLPSSHLTREYLSLLNTRTRANPMERECIEVSLTAVSSSICDALLGKSSFIFRIQDGTVTTVSPLVISNQSTNQTRIFLRPIIHFIKELLLAEQSLLDIISISGENLPSQLCHIALQYLKNIRDNAIVILYTRPFPCSKSIRKNIECIIEKGNQFISLSRQLIKLRDSSCAECIDSLIIDLSEEQQEELSFPILSLLRFALSKTLEHTESFMLSGEISKLGFIIETKNGSTLSQPYHSGRSEGERWRKNYGIRVGHAISIDKTIADEIMAEGKLALMRLRDPSLVEEYSTVSWKEFKEERDKERSKLMMNVKRGICATDVKEMFRASIKWVRMCGDRSMFLSRQIHLVANSLEIVWQVFLLGDRVTRIPHFDGSIMERFQSMRDAIAAFPHEHLLAVNLTKVRSSCYIQLRVSGALSIIVSSSNITIYTEAHKLLSKLSQVYHQISEAYLCLPPLHKGCDHLLRGLHKGLAEITHWVGKLCGHFCTQVHEVVWKQTNKEVLASLPSFDVLFAIHRKALKQLATMLFLNTSAVHLSSALHTSIDASSEFARNIECEEWEKAAVNYTNFIEAAQMFTHGLIVGDDPLLLRNQLLLLIDPIEKFRM